MGLGQSVENSESAKVPTLTVRQFAFSCFTINNQIYSTELENQPQFSGFQDRFKTFELYKGKKTGDPFCDEDNYAGKFKVGSKLELWSLSNFFHFSRVK